MNVCQRRFHSIVWIFVFWGACGIQAAEPHPFDPRVYTFRGPLNYIVFLPQDYEKNAHSQWPLILFLHGMGDHGDTLQDLEYLKKSILQSREGLQIDFPFIMLVPQCPASSYWHNQLDNLNALLNEIVKAYKVDSARIYLTGLSMGGSGSWELAWRYPERFAAVVPIATAYIGDSSRITEKTICKLKNIPIWIFHGGQDTQLSVAQATERAQALKACGGNVRLTLYPDLAHNAWTATYRNPELYAWLLLKRNPYVGERFLLGYRGGILIFILIAMVGVYGYIRKVKSKKYQGGSFRDPPLLIE